MHFFLYAQHIHIQHILISICICIFTIGIFSSINSLRKFIFQIWNKYIKDGF